MHSLRSSFPSLPSLPVFFSLIVISHYFCLSLFHFFSSKRLANIYIYMYVYICLRTHILPSQHSSLFHLTIYSVVRVQRYNRGIKNRYEMQAFLHSSIHSFSFLFYFFHRSTVFVVQLYPNLFNQSTIDEHFADFCYYESACNEQLFVYVI